MNGLQNMDDSVPEVRNLLSALMDKAVVANEQGAQFCKDREISMAMFGMQRMGVHRDVYGFSGGSTSPGFGAFRYIPSLSLFFPSLSLSRKFAMNMLICFSLSLS